MKTHFQLSIEFVLKQRLTDLSQRTGIPVAKIIDKILTEQLAKYEERFSAVDQTQMNLTPNARGKSTPTRR